MTCSIIARDEQTGALGAAVESHFLAVGRHVVAARTGIGVVATQAEVRAAYRSCGLERMQAGLTAPDAPVACLAEDERPHVRQVAMIDAAGNVAAHTGAECWNHYGHDARDGVSAQANMAASAGIPTAMVEAYLAAEGHFAHRLLAALDAAQRAGGDLRGRQSAAILVVEGNPPGQSEDGVILDLRVDDDPDPLSRLTRTVHLALAFKPMWNAIRGPACRGPVQATPAQTADVLRVLEEAQDAYGTENLEPTFWKAVALWRAARIEESLAAIAQVSADAPGWRQLFTDVTSRWPVNREIGGEAQQLRRPRAKRR